MTEYLGSCSCTDTLVPVKNKVVVTMYQLKLSALYHLLEIYSIPWVQKQVEAPASGVDQQAKQ